MQNKYLRKMSLKGNWHIDNIDSENFLLTVFSTGFYRYQIKKQICSESTCSLIHEKKLQLKIMVKFSRNSFI